MPGGNKNITVRLMADATQFNASLKTAGENTKQLADNMGNSGKRTALLTTGLAAAGMAATSFGIAAINTFREFDATMSGVQAATGATANEMSQLREAAISAGASTIYSANEAAQAQIELGKAGLSTADILSGGLSGALNLAASDGMQVADAAELMASTLAQFNLTGQDAARVADALAAGAGNAQGSAQDLGYGLSQAGMVAHEFGLTMEDTVGTLAAFANQGMIGSDAGTSLKTMLLALAKPSKQAQQTMDELGIAAYDAQGKFVGLSNLAGQLHDKMAGLTDQQREQAMATIFGQDAIRSATALYREGADGIEAWAQKVGAAGYAAEQAAKRNDNLNGDIENLSGSFETLMLQVGAGANGPLRSIVQTLDTLVDAFGSLPAEVQQGVVVMVAFAGAAAALHKTLGPLSDSTSSVARGFQLAADPVQRLQALGSGLQDAFQQVRLSMQPASAQIAAVGTAAAPATLRLGALRSVGSGLVGLMGGPWGIAFSIAAFAVGAWAKKAQEAKQHAESLKSALDTTGDATENIIEHFSSINLDNSPLVPDFIEQAYYGYTKLTDVLDDVGIKLSDMALAAQGDADAIKRINSVTDEMIAQGGKQRDLAGIIKSYLNEETDAYNKATDATKKKKDAVNEVKDAQSGASGAIQQTTSAIESQNKQVTDALDGLKKWIDMLFQIPGSELSADQAITRLADVIRQTSKTIVENGANLDINTQKGNENVAALEALASQAQNTAEKILENGQALYENTGSQQAMRDAISQANDQLGIARDKFVEAAQQAGYGADAANALADKYGLVRGKADELASSINRIEEDKKVTITANTDDAQNKVRSLSAMIAGLHDKTVTVTTVHTIMREFVNQYGGGNTKDYAPGVSLPRANGGIIPGYAHGGQPYAGYVGGWGGKKSDNRLIAASPGEYVHQAEAVDYYGVNRMRALNSRSIPKEWLDGPVIAMDKPETKNIVLNMPVKVVRSSQSLSSTTSILLRNATREARMM